MKLNRSPSFPQGGVHPPDCKFSADKPIRKLPLPEKVALHLSQHIGKPAVPVVHPKDTVKAGQLIAKADGFISANIHASVSGQIEKIEPMMDQSGYKKPAIIIKTDGDIWLEGIDRSPDLLRDITVDGDTIRRKVAEAGIIGLGGAGFPSHVKMHIPEGKHIEYLLINGVECEPYLTSDHRLMLEKGAELIVGIQLILKALGIGRAVVGIEENKPDAIENLRRLAANTEQINIQLLKVQYPQGGERQLVKALTGREIPPPPKGLPIDVACAVFNVATVFAVYEAVQKNKPCIERTVTVSGPRLSNPANFRVRVGTPITALIAAAGGVPEETGKILSGGPMMGKALAQTDIPISKSMGGIVVLPAGQSTRQPMAECIRCGKCVAQCPLGVEPYLVMTLTEKGMFDRAEQERILSCCECGCCQYICPSNRPLLDYIRLGKNIVGKIVRSRNQK